MQQRHREALNELESRVLGALDGGPRTRSSIWSEVQRQDVCVTDLERVLNRLHRGGIIRFARGEDQLGRVIELTPDWR